MDDSEAQRLLQDAIAYMISGSPDRAADEYSTMMEQASGTQLLGAFLGLAEVSKSMVIQIFGDQAPNPTFGDMWYIDMIGPADNAEPHELLALRAIVATANGDEDTVLSLYKTICAWPPEGYMDAMLALFTTACGLVKLVTDKKKEEKEDA